MALSVGTRLGPYEIQAPIGAGGMGEVYRARDTRLERTVAIKVLPAHLSGNAELRQRFEREARAISSLNHPHICTLHDIGHQDGTDFLVMEHLEGETLAQRLQKGPLPTEQLLRYAIQITDALDKAHRQGVTHRDLKPANVMLTKAGAKLLDFGLAKFRRVDPVIAVATGGETTENGAAPDKKLTVEGTILGTFQYMAPEQLEGKEADARTDIFAFGAVLYEMATGQPPFQGRSKASLITAIMSAEPAPISQLQPMTPPALERVVKTCLAKDPDERWQTAHDLLLQLKWIAEAGSQAGMPAPVVARRRSRERLGWIVALSLLIPLGGALVLSVIHLREAPPKARLVRFLVPPPEGVNFNWYDVPVISPDGQRLAFTGADRERRPLLWIRSLDSLTAQTLPGTEFAFFPFWSPDSRSIAFFSSNAKLKRIDLEGGPPRTLCDAPNAGGGTWNRDGVIIFGSSSRLHRVSADGGGAKPLLELDKTRGETGVGFPYFLPDGRHFLYLSVTATAGQGAIYVGALDSKQTQRVLAVESNAAYAPPGLLVFARGSTLMAQPFDATKLQTMGEEFPIVEQVALFGQSPGASFSVSENGVLAHRTGSATAKTQLVWFDRAGNRVAAVGEPADYSNPSLSADEKKLAVGRRDPQTKTRDIWVFDLVRGTSSRLTFDAAEDINPTWSPDGARIAFTSNRKGGRDLYQKLASGAGDDELLLELPGDENIEDWSADGRFLLFNSSDPKRLADVSALPLFGDRKPMPLLKNPFVEAQARLSPNGKWMAYYSNESGRSEVYVQNFPPSAGKWQISTAGGVEPQWRRDGKELFYLQGTKLLAVEVKTGSTNFEAGIPKVLFETRLSTFVRNRYVVAENGQRFLVNIPFEETSSSPITVVLNWTAGRRRD